MRIYGCNIISLLKQWVVAKAILLRTQEMHTVHRPRSTHTHTRITSNLIYFPKWMYTVEKPGLVEKLGFETIIMLIFDQASV